MTDSELKIKKAFELSDLLYFCEVDRISAELKRDLSKISDSHESRGIFYSGMHVKNIFERRIEAIKQLVNSRLKLDEQEINKIYDFITINISDSIFERAKQIIEGQIENLKFVMVKFCRHFPSPDSYLDLINIRLRYEKTKLISYVKREVDIFQKQSESNVQKHEKKEKKFIVSEIIEKIDSVNLLMKKNYNVKLFEIQEQNIWDSLSEPC